VRVVMMGEMSLHGWNEKSVKENITRMRLTESSG